MNNTVRWRIHFMLLNKVVLEGTDILLVIFAIYLFSCYFDIFFTRRKKRILAGIGYMVFVIWQFVLSSVSMSIPIKMSTFFGNSEHPFPEKQSILLRNRVQLIFLIFRWNCYSMSGK